MKLNIDKKIRAGYMTAFILLFLSYSLTFYTTRQLLKQVQQVDITNDVINNLEVLLSDVKDAELGAAGFLLMKDSSYLETYNSGYKNVDSIKEELKTIINEDSREQKEVDALEILISTKFRLLSGSIQSFVNNNFVLPDSIKQESTIHKLLMDSIRKSVKQIQVFEMAKYKQKQEEFQGSSVAIKIINITSLVIAIILAVYSLNNFNKENKAKNEAHKKVLLYQQQLEERVDQLHASNVELVNLRSIEKFASTGRIARTIAHEVRNPLTNISLATEQLHEEIASNEETDLLIDMINRNVTRISHLISDLLQSTKFTQLDFRKASINQILDETLEFAKDRIELNSIHIEKEYSPNICDVSVDSEKIKIAFLNVIVNAVEAMEPCKGILKLKTETKKEKCVITISDNGKGIEKDLQTRVFEPYFSSKTKGGGLGLTNTQNIILNHNGQIHVESESGKGTRFIITLNFSS